MQRLFYSIETIIKLKLLNTFLKNILFVTLISIFIYVIFTAFSIYSFSRIDETTNADAAIVLGASVWNNKPSPVFQERINHGIWLYQNGFVNYLIFTGGVGKESNISESSVAKNYAINKGIPNENIFIEEKSKITFENILYANNIIKNNNLNNVIIVSDPMHMKRSITMANDFNLNAYSSPTPTTQYISFKTKASFLFYELFFLIQQWVNVLRTIKQITIFFFLLIFNSYGILLLDKE